MRGWPPAWVTSAYTVARPSPDPQPFGLVVKKGSNARSTTAGLIPVPVSLTRSRTYRPGVSPGCVAAMAASTLTFVVSIDKVPPSGMASRAFVARFTRSCSI
jgi:hypothetical protein